VAETLLNQQEPIIETGKDPQNQNSQLKRIVGIILSIVMITLTVYVLNLQNQNSNTLSKSMDLALMASDQATSNYRTYVGRYKETKAELEETTRKLEAVNTQLNQVTAELASTKGLLSESQGLLASAQDENIKLKQELQGLGQLQGTDRAQNVAELQDKIKVLKDKDAEVSMQLTDLKGQLHAFQGDFSNLEEGKSLITLFRSKIILVKTRMRYLRQQAYLTKVAAQKEKDRIAALNGNNGFVLRNGQPQNPNGSNKSFAVDVKIVQ
jgi:chromosome segregation ATPase